MGLPLAMSTWGVEELNAIQKVVDSGQFTMNKNVEIFEERFASYHNSKYCVMVNSGSSANLLAVAAFFHHSSKRLKRGDEVIVPAISWATTYSPLYHYGLKVKFVDVDSKTLNIDCDVLKRAISNKTKAIFLVNLLGNPNKFDIINNAVDGKDIIIIEDNCESLGATFMGKKTGSFGDVGTSSLFFSHHISTMEGGAIITDDDEIYHILLSLRSHGWTRHLPIDNTLCKKGDDPFYESFRFILPGYNLRPLELSGAIGLEQLEKLDSFIHQRRENATYYQKIFRTNDKVCIPDEVGSSSWFAFPFVLNRNYSDKDRRKIIKEFYKNQIECRPIVAGNFVRNKAVEWFDYEVFENLSNADWVHQNGFMVGNHHYDITKELDKIQNIFEEIL